MKDTGKDSIIEQWQEEIEEMAKPPSLRLYEVLRPNPIRCYSILAIIGEKGKERVPQPKQTFITQ